MPTISRVKLSIILILICASVVFRIYYLYYLFPLDKYVFSDMAIYLQNAKALVTGIPVTQLFSKPPFYEWLLAFSIQLSNWKIFSNPLTFIQGLQFLLSLAIPILLAYSSKKWLGKKAAYLILLIGLFYFPFIQYAGLIMAEIPFAFLLSLLILLIVKSRYPWSANKAVLIGIIWGLAFFLKGQAVLFPPIAFVYSILFYFFKVVPEKSKKFSKIISAWLFFLVGASFIYGGQAAVKKWALKTPNTIPSVGALNFASARCSNCKLIVDSKDVWTCSSKFHQIGGCDVKCKFDAPFEDSQFYWKQGVKCLVENPYNIFTSLTEVRALFVGNEAFPFLEISDLRMLNRDWELFFQLFLLPGIILGCFWRFRFKGSIRIGLIHCLGLNILVMAYLFAGETRYRIPFDTIFLPLAIATWLKFSSKLKTTSFLR